MDKQMLEIIFDEEKDDTFSGEEIATFKRYIEENVAYSENNFEFLEGNLAYYASRHTSEHYFSPAEYFHVNSNLTKTDEMQKNIDLYNKMIEWHSSTVHPQDSEYVLKKEKYVDLEDFSIKIKNFIQYLNGFEKWEFFIVDLLIYKDGEMYQYLPQKDFLFKWKNHSNHILEKIQQHKYFSFQDVNQELMDEKNPILLIPIFIPIRKMLFLGEYGYKSGLIQYGTILNKINQYFSSTDQKYEQIDLLETTKINEIFRLDGVERSILSIFITK